MSETIEISGVLNDPGGRAVSGARIVITAHRNSAGVLNQSVTTATTAADGRYALQLLPGGYTVTVVWPGNVRPEVLGRITVEEDGPAASLNDYLINADDFYSDKVVFNSVKSLADDSMVAAALAKTSGQASEAAATAAAEEKTQAVVAAETASQEASTAETAAILAAAARDEALAAARAQSFDELRTTAPVADGQRWRLRGWHDGTDYGGGDFTGFLVAATDDGGTIAAGEGWHWQRVTDDDNNLNVSHFGATEGGDVDCSAAVIAMFNYSQKNNPALGIRFPAGKFRVDNVDISSKYYSRFRLTGAQVNFGYFPSTTIVSNKTTGVMFSVNARYTEISNLIIDGEYDVTANTKEFYSNSCTAGTYFRGTNLRFLNLGGRAISLIDTLDTKLDQFYASMCHASVLYTNWSNTVYGNWDHVTAIELTNFNMQSCTTEPVFDIQRATQSFIYNGWIEKSEYPGDLSCGQMMIEGLSVEACTNPLNLTYCRAIISQLNLQSGSTVTHNDVDKTDWLSRFERGYLRLENYGAQFHGSLTYDVLHSHNRISNGSANTKWVYVGKVHAGTTGDTSELIITGTTHWDTVTESHVVNDTRHGGGKCIIRMQNKDDAERVLVSWSGEGACPVADVKFKADYASDINIYVQLRNYVQSANVQLETTGKSRFETGQCAYFDFKGESLTDDEIAALDGLRDALPKFSLSAGWAGLGFDGGMLMIRTTFTDGKIPIYVNGELKYITISDS
ncbi:amylovoran biosynthesis protein AmsF [Erwinia endophytica]|uniref:prophage tail fiber N-terminal domain-containing protein n=1 Tax=Erwinia endophytica TaxID=1563158 RepID=UPI001265DEE8|nr:prophage tail fiber N-terminal domain-containing protein [Erwinia endophytica]KAB8307273.1 amylovoran biosynthesis protein AmsF [Erwinia endophytica]